jgi:hypothetical protein
MPDIGTGICGCIKLRMDGDVINSENIQVVFKVKTKIYYISVRILFSLLTSDRFV